MKNALIFCLSINLAIGEAAASEILRDRNFDHRLDSITVGIDSITDQKIDRNFDGVWDKWNVRKDNTFSSIELANGKAAGLISEQSFGNYVVRMEWKQKNQKKLKLSLRKRFRAFNDDSDEMAAGMEDQNTINGDLSCSIVTCAKCNAHAIAKNLNRMSLIKNASCDPTEVEDFASVLDSRIECVLSNSKDDLRIDGLTMALVRLRQSLKAGKSILRCSKNGPPGKLGEANLEDFEMVLYYPEAHSNFASTAFHELLHLGLSEGCKASENKLAYCEERETQEAEVKTWLESVSTCTSQVRVRAQHSSMLSLPGTPLVKVSSAKSFAKAESISPATDQILSDTSKPAATDTIAEMKTAVLASAEIPVPAGVHFEKIEMNGADASKLTFEMTPTQALEKTTQAMAEKVVTEVDGAWDKVKGFVNDELIPRAQATEQRSVSSRTPLPSEREESHENQAAKIDTGRNEPIKPSETTSPAKIKPNLKTASVENAVDKIGKTPVPVVTPSQSEPNAPEKPSAPKSTGSQSQSQVRPVENAPTSLERAEAAPSQAGAFANQPQAPATSPRSQPVQVANPRPAPQPMANPANYQILIRTLTKAKRDEIRNLNIETLRANLDDVGFERELKVQGIAIADADQGRSPASVRNQKKKNRWGASYDRARKRYLIRDGKLTYMGSSQ